MKTLYERGKLIKEYRNAYGFTQKELADQLSISPSQISKIESGTYQPAEGIMKKLIRYLKIKELSPQRNDQLAGQLSSWQKSIQQRNITASDRYYQQLKKFPVSYFHNQQSIFHLQSFQHALLKLQIQKASSLLPVIKKEIKRLSERASYPFHKSLGYYYILVDSLKNATHFLKKAATAKPEESERDGELHFYFSLLYHKLKQIPYSMEHSSLTIHLFQQKMNHPNVLLGHIMTAMNDLVLNKQERGLERIKNVLSQSSNSSVYNLPAVHYLLAAGYLQQQNYNEALYYAKEALHEEQESFMKQAYLYFVAYIFAIMRNKKQALSYIEAGTSLKANPKYQYKLLILRAIVQWRVSSPAFQQQLKEEIIPFFQEKGDMAELNECYQLMGDLLYSAQKYKQSAFYYEQTTGTPHYVSELMAKYKPH